MSTSANTSTETQEVEKGIFLHIKAMNQQTAEGDPVENKILQELNFTIDFTGSEDILIENSENNLVLETFVKAECSETIACVKEYPHSRLLWQINWSKQEATRDRQLQFQQKAHANLKAQIERAKKIFKTYPLAESPLEDIEKMLFENTFKNFVDPEFPPSDESVFNETDQDKRLVVHWRRPQDFMFTEGDDDIKIFYKSIEPSDIKAGPHSYRWILCALATLAERPSLVEKLFITKEYKQNGTYRLNINKNGVWTELTIDDYMPCQLDGPPLFTRTHGNELWVQLLEKAYAKLHGSYEQLKHGHPNEALQDFTGFPTVVYDFNDSEIENFLKTGDFFKTLVNFYQEGYLLSATAPGQIENLWGYFVWDGAWSRKSAFWTPDIKEILKPNLDEDDGTFWMSYEDFIRYFSAVNVCKVKPMNEIRLKGKFIRVQDQEHSQVISKWYYYLDVHKKTHLMLGAHQFDEKVKKVLPRRQYLDIGFLILQRTHEGTGLHDVQDFINGRDCEYETILEPGQYVILPRTNGVSLKRPLNPKQEQVTLLNEQRELSEIFEGTLEDIYYRFDTMISNSIDYNEFKDFQETVGEQPYSTQDYEAKILKNYTSTSRGLTLKGFKQFILDTIRNEDENKIWTWLEKLGYDKDLYSSFSRTLIYTFHSEQPLTLQVGDNVSTNLDQAAQSMILRERASILENKADCCLLYYPKTSPIDAYMFGCENRTTVPIEVTFSVARSQNCERSTNHSTIKRIIEPNKVEFLVNVRRDDIRQALTLDIDFKHKLIQ